jgi:phage repressor protein C with HTH and peptisase S24 domain
MTKLPSSLAAKALFNVFFIGSNTGSGGKTGMMIKRIRKGPEYKSRGNAKRRLGLSDNQKRAMKQRREELGISQAELGHLIAQHEGLDEAVAQATISNLEKIDPTGRKPSLASKHLPTIEKILRLDPGFLKPSRQHATVLRPVAPSAQIVVTPTDGAAPRQMSHIDAGVSRTDMTYGAVPTVQQATAATFGAAQDLPVYFSLYGQDGVMIVEIEPAEYMQRPGKLATVQRSYGVRVVAGYCMEPRFVPGDLIFINPVMAILPTKSILLRRQEQGGEVLLGYLVAQTATEWTIQQLNPARTFSVSKSEWPIAHRIIGLYEE